MRSKPFRDRREAGRRLTRRLTHYAKHPDARVLALPRGGVPVAYEVARALDLPLDILVVRKLRVPGHPELAMGAIASGGGVSLNPRIVASLHLTPDEVATLTASEYTLLEQQEQALGAGPRPSIEGRVAILIDDGLATGATMRAALTVLRQQAPSRLVVAVPVAAPASAARVDKEADEVLCLMVPEDFRAVSRWYLDFSQVSEDDVRQLVKAHQR